MNAQKPSAGSPKSSREAIELEVGPQIAWHTLTEPRELANWLEPGAQFDRAIGGKARVSSLAGQGFDGEIVDYDSTRRLVARVGNSTVDELDFQMDRRGSGVMVRAVRTRVFASNGDERIASEAREWRFRWLSLRQYVEKHRRTEPRIALATIRTELAPADAWRVLVGPKAFAREGSLEKTQRRDMFELVTADGEHLTGRVQVHEPNGQLAAILEGSTDALFSLEVLRGESDTLAVARYRAFDVAAAKVAELEARWKSLLASAFAI